MASISLKQKKGKKIGKSRHRSRGERNRTEKKRNLMLTLERKKMLFGGY